MQYTLYMGLVTQATLEPVNRQSVIDCVTQYFDGFNIIDSIGYWQGASEPCLNITIMTDKEQSVYSLARELRDKFNQTSVLVTVTNISYNFI